MALATMETGICMPDQLSGFDSMFLLLDEPRAPLEVSTLQIYNPASAPNGRAGFDEVRSVFAARLGRTRLLRRKLQSVPLGLDHP
jgi:hypothetical protein